MKLPFGQLTREPIRSFQREGHLYLTFPLLADKPATVAYRYEVLAAIPGNQRALDAALPLHSCEPPCRAIVVWTPVVTLTPAMATAVSSALGVEVRVAA